MYWGSRGDSYISKWLRDHKSGLNWPKKRPNSPPNCYLPLWQGTQQLLHWQRTNSIFIKWPSVKILGIKRGFLHSKWLPYQQRGLNWPKNSKITPKNSMLPSDRRPDKCFIDNQPLYVFSKNGPTYIYWGSKGNSQLTKWLPDHNSAWIGQKRPNHPKNVT